MLRRSFVRSGSCPAGKRYGGRAGTGEGARRQADAPGKVEVQDVAKDGDIRQRIADILETTDWYGEPDVTVQQGIVFLKGTNDNVETKQWAGDLARNSEGVVAVVNQFEVASATVLDFEPTRRELNRLAPQFVRSLPLIVVAVVVIAIAWRSPG